MTNSASELRLIGEFSLIAELFAPLATAPGAFGLTDDAAVWAPARNHDLVLTTDAVVEGVHFFRTDPPNLVGKKALRVNLSDLVAKGAAPAGYLLALSLPPWVDKGWLREFASGLLEDQQQFGASLLGGDTTATPGPLSIAITALGEAPRDKMIRRAGAKPGDAVFVTGTIGDAGAGLRCLKGEGTALVLPLREYLIRRFQLPEPRTKIGSHLTGIASAALDVSDGLIADLGHMAEASMVRIELRADRVPISASLVELIAKPQERIVFAATAGDDYEIAFTAPREWHAELATLAEESGVRITRIGDVVEGSGVALLDPAGVKIPIARAGYVHF